MIEEFRNIKGYEGLYQVSNLGRVKSLTSFKKNGKSGYMKKERVLKGVIDFYGYLCVGLAKDGKSKTFKIHQLVAVAFLNHTPNRHKIVVDHIDNNPLDNRVENIQLITSRENTSKDKKDGTSKYIGVSWYKPSSKWVAHIKIKGKSKYLGYFVNELEASEAYQDALKSI